MRLTRLSAARFMRLANWEADLDAPMVVFLGSNEAGKSTVKELVASLLFGFGSRKKDRLPLIGWGASQASAVASLRLDDGREMTVTRLLEEKHASCEVFLSGQTQQMGNAPLSFTGAVTRDIYESIYGLGRDQIVFPGETWPEVADRLLDIAVVDRLRPAADAAQELDEEAKGFWRADKRGKPRSRELSDERWRLKQVLREARDRQARLMELQSGMEERRDRIELLRARVRDSEAFLREAAIQRELRKRYDLIREQEREAGDAAAYDALPEDIAGKLRQLREGIGTISEKLAEDRAQLAAFGETCRRFTEAHQKALGMAREIEEATRLSAQLADDGQAAAQLRGQLDAVRGEARSLSVSLLTDDDPAVAERLGRIDMGALKEASAKAVDAAKKLFRAQDTLERAKENLAGRRRIPVLGGILGGALLLAGAAGLLPLFVDWLPYALPYALTDPLAWVAAGAAVAGLLSLVLALAGMRPGRRTIEPLERDCAEAVLLSDQAASAVRKALCGLPVPGERIDKADEKLPWDVERLRMKYEQAEELADKLGQIERRIAENGEVVARCAALCLGRAPGGPAGVEAMNALLGESRDLRGRAEAAAAGIERIGRQTEREAGIHARASEELKNLLAALSRVGSGDPEEAIALISRRRALRRQAQAGREALLSDERFASRLPKLEAMEARWPYRDETVAETQEYVQGARHQLEMLNGELGSIEQEIKNLADQPGPGEIQSRIDAIGRAETEEGLERDMKVLTAAIIRAGRRRFQERHQPDVIRRASVYMDRITGGRYGRLILPEDGSGLRVYSPEAGRYVDPEVDRLSKGTLCQLYLALRLAMVDHLDPPGEPLPLLLDEVFADWDDQRLTQGLRVAADVSGTRQVLLFTCHPWMAERLAEAGAGHKVVRL